MPLNDSCLTTKAGLLFLYSFQFAAAFETGCIFSSTVWISSPHPSPLPPNLALAITSLFFQHDVNPPLLIPSTSSLPSLAGGPSAKQTIRDLSFSSIIFDYVVADYVVADVVVWFDDEDGL